MWYTHTHTHTHIQWNISHKNNEIMPPAATWMDLDIINIILSELSQRKTNMILFTYH